MGDATRASGYASMAMGSSTTASGNFSTAMGTSTTASGDYSTAMGKDTEANGIFSTAMGEHTTAQAQGSLVIGRYNKISGTSGSWVDTDPLFVAGNGSNISNPSNALTLLKNGKLGLGTASPAVALHVAGDDGFVATGTFGSGSLPVSGAGTRLLWYPKKAAFRAGRVDGNQWDESNIGAYSVAMGNRTTASGDYSTAMGKKTNASGDYSTVMGSATTASGDYSTAMGLVTTASGDLSTAMGDRTTAATPSSLSVGSYNDSNRSSDNTAFVVGNGTNESNRSDALTLLKNGNLTIAGTLTQSSDRRLKTDIHPLTDALAGIKQLQPVHYRFRAGTNRPQEQQIGLISQEVQAVFPELVRTGTDGYMSVSYTNLSAVLVQALKEQQAEIETLQDRLARLEAALLSADTTSANR